MTTPGDDEPMTYRPATTPPRTDRRIAGILVPLFSVRTARSWGIGEITDLPELCRWALDHGHRLVQLLPINALPDGETSPYSAATSFAIDPMYVSVDRLEDVRTADRAALLGPGGESLLARLRASPTIDYAAVRLLKRRVLRAAFERFYVKEWERSSSRARALATFAQDHRDWLDDYALFSALKSRFGGSWWLDWPAGVRDREPHALAEHSAELARSVLGHKYAQWIAYQQWADARGAANKMGVELMGDLPFMVGIDSADVWGDRKSFLVDATIGVQGDAFSEEGQDWGLPAYNWQAMDTNDLAWVRRRCAFMGRLFDRFRVDHLVGYFRMYVRPKAGAPHFVPGDEPSQIARGERVLRAMLESAASAGAHLVAEDLGIIPDFVRASLTKLGIPGYKVLLWERDGDVFRDAAEFPACSLATSGTHDTLPIATWWESLSFDDRRHALAEIPSLRAVADAKDVDRFTPAVHDALLDALYGAGSELVLLPIQDILGTTDRVNTPATIGAANWTYRLATPLEDLHNQSAVEARMSVARDLARKHGR